jgi:hypothetical protein
LTRQEQAPKVLAKQVVSPDPMDKSWVDLIKDQPEFPPPIIVIEEHIKTEKPTALANPAQNLAHKNSMPANNTCLQHKMHTITQDHAYHLTDVSAPFPAQQALLWKYYPPLQFFHPNWVQPILNNETGDLLEYHHLMKHPKYKDISRIPSAKKSINLPLQPRPLPSSQSKTFPTKPGARASDMAILSVSITLKKRTHIKLVSHWVAILSTTQMTVVHPPPTFLQLN